MLHLPLRATIDNSVQAADGKGQTYFEGFQRLMDQSRARRTALLDRCIPQGPSLSPLLHQKHSGNNPSSTSQEHHSLLGKRKAAGTHTDDHDHEHLALDAAGDACTDYQTCRDLWDALSSVLQRMDDATDAPATRLAYVRFRGSYAFVADPKVPPRRRVELVSKDLRRFAKLRHGDLLGGSQQQNAYCWSETYRCECSRDRRRSLPPASPPIPVPSPSVPHHIQTATSPYTSQTLKSSMHAPPTTQPNPTAHAPPVKRAPTQSTLAGWLTSTHKSTKTPPAPRPSVPASAQAVEHGERPASCDGRLHITVEDIAHPLGYYTGQKVTVVLEHPRR